ncbi:hypothetical protein ACU8OG_09550 [Rhizobium leguminosarum]
MPKPLAEFEANYSFGSLPGDIIEKRPEACLQAAGVLAAWATLDSNFLGLFVSLFDEPAPAAAVYTGLSSHAQQKALKAAAKMKMSTEELSVLRAIQKSQDELSSTRNKLAHWPWGYSGQLDDALLLVDPAMLAENTVAGALYTADLRNDTRPPWEKEWRDYPEPDRSRILVFTNHELNEVRSRIDGTSGNASMLTRVMDRGHLANRDNELFAYLCARPGVKEHLSM